MVDEELLRYFLLDPLRDDWEQEEGEEEEEILYLFSSLEPMSQGERDVEEEEENFFSFSLTKPQRHNIQRLRKTLRAFTHKTSHPRMSHTPLFFFFFLW